MYTDIYVSLLEPYTRHRYIVQHNSAFHACRSDQDSEVNVTKSQLLSYKASTRQQEDWHPLECGKELGRNDPFPQSHKLRGKVKH